MSGHGLRGSINPSFADWADRGFEGELIPVIPPGVPAKVHGGATIGDGKMPGSRIGFHPDNTLRFVSPNTYYGFAAWRTQEIDPSKLLAWDEHGMPSNIGLRTAQYPCLDIDIKHADDRALVEAILEQVRAECAPTKVWLRYRDNSPSCAVLFALADGAEPFSKGSRAFITPSGHEAKIELLASGQQIVVAGMHASGAPLRWRQIGAKRDSFPKLDVGFPDIDAGGANMLLDAIYNLVLRGGGQPPRSNAGTGSCGKAPDTTPPWVVQPGDDPFYQRLFQEEFLEAAVQDTNGRWKSQMNCPWEGDHGERPETGTAYFVGGGFSCAHNGCAGRRWPDVVNVLRRLGWPVDAMQVELWNSRQRAQREQGDATLKRHMAARRSA